MHSSFKNKGFMINQKNIICLITEDKRNLSNKDFNEMNIKKTYKFKPIMRFYIIFAKKYKTNLLLYTIFLYFWKLK